MPSLVNTTVKGVPRFLTSNFDAHQKDITEKAVAHYIVAHKLTPQKFANQQFKIKNLLQHLQKFDARWIGIHPD